jgi:hypothetical protein
MLQAFVPNVSSVFSHKCWKYVYLMLHMFHAYVASVLFGCCIYFVLVFPSVLMLFWKCFRRVLSSYACCKCSFQCFKSRLSLVAGDPPARILQLLGHHRAGADIRAREAERARVVSVWVMTARAMLRRCGVDTRNGVQAQTSRPARMSKRRAPAPWEYLKVGSRVGRETSKYIHSGTQTLVRWLGVLIKQVLDG